MKKPSLKDLTLREKIAQTLFVRQSDLLLRADKDYAVAREAGEAIEIMEKNQFGGVWGHGNVDVNSIKGSLDKSFTFTAKTFSEWLGKLKTVCKYPLMCANDPSGAGSYSDVKSVALGLNLGAANSEELSFKAGVATAMTHAKAGVDWLWAPMVDLVSPYTTGIVRPYAGEQDILIKCAREFIKGMQSENVAACAKHFPGQDPTEMRDGHVTPTVLSTSLEKWLDNQGRVFKELIDAGVYTVMSGGVAFPAVDDTKIGDNYLPSSLSYKIITGLLKEQLGFKGVVISDDVTMGGYTTAYPDPEDLYVELLKAGQDVLLGVNINAVDIVQKAVLDGRLSEERIDDACQRVLDMKEKLGLFDGGTERNYTIEEANEYAKDTLKEISEKAVTLVRNEGNLLPVKKENIKTVTIVTFSHRDGYAKSLEPMKKAFEERGARVILRDRPESFTDIEDIDAESDLIIYAGHIYFHCPKGAPSFFGDVFWSLRYAFTRGREKSVGISLGYPYIHHDFFAAAPSFVNLYVTSDEIQTAFVRAVYGEIEFEGIAPINYDRTYVFKE